MTSPLDRYCQQHGHLLQTRARAGDRTFRIGFADGYVVIEAYGGGIRSQKIFIPRNAWVKLLTRSIKPTKLMSRSVDPEVLFKAYHKLEVKLAAGIKEQKRRHHKRVGRS